MLPDFFVQRQSLLPYVSPKVIFLFFSENAIVVLVCQKSSSRLFFSGLVRFSLFVPNLKVLGSFWG